jgi:hypothetical protein
MGEVIGLHGRSNPLEDDELIEDLARFADNTLNESAVKARHHLSNEDWAALGENDKLVELVESRKLQRIRGGQTKRERAQIEIVDAPPILGGIMRDSSASPKHKIDSIKALDSLATGGSSEAATAGARFEIFINLGDQTLHFDKPIAIDTDPNQTDDAPQDEWLPVIAASKKEDSDGGGQEHF